MNILTEESVISQISVDEYGRINVQRADRVLRDGVMIAETYHRHVVDAHLGNPAADASGEHARVQSLVAWISGEARQGRPFASRPLKRGP